MPKHGWVAIGIDSTIELWDVAHRRHVKTLSGNEAIFTHIVAGKGEERLFAGDADGNISVWNINTGQKLVALSGHEKGTGVDVTILGVQEMVWSEHGKTLFTGDRTGGIRAWESESPSIATSVERRRVEAARSLVDRLSRSDEDSAKLNARIDQADTRSDEIARVAKQIVASRGELLSFSAEENARRTRLRKLGLDRSWLHQVERSTQERRRASNALVRRIEKVFGVDLRSNTPEVVPWEWLEFLNAWAADPTSTSQLQLLHSTVVSQHSTSPFGHLAGCHLRAANQKYQRAKSDLTAAIACVDSKTDFGLVLAAHELTLEVQLEDAEFADHAEGLLELAENCQNGRVLWRIARASLLAPTSQSRLASIERLVQRINPDDIPPKEISWYWIVTSRLQFDNGKFDEALKSSRKAVDHISDGPTGNYARSTAYYFLALAAERVGDEQSVREGRGAISFILKVQPFVRPDSPSIHRSWEDWICHKFLTQTDA